MNARGDSCDWTSEVIDKLAKCDTLFKFYSLLYIEFQKLKDGKVPLEKLVCSLPHTVSDFGFDNMGIFTQRLKNKGIIIRTPRVYFIYAQDTRIKNALIGGQMWMLEEITPDHKILIQQYTYQISKRIRLMMRLQTGFTFPGVDLNKPYTYLDEKGNVCNVNLGNPVGVLRLFSNSRYDNIVDNILYQVCETLRDLSVTQMLISKVSLDNLPSEILF